MDNAEIADSFSLLSKLMDIHGENGFRAKSYSTAAYNIDRLPTRLDQVERSSIASLQGIGESTARKIVELLDTGRLMALDDLLSKTPQGILEMLKVKGLGPKKIATVWKDMGIESIGELLYACEENRLMLLKGFGEKTQSNVKEAVEFMLRHKGSFLYAECVDTVAHAEERMTERLPARRLSVTGAYRRQSPVVTAIEWVTSASAMEILAAWEDAGLYESEVDGDDLVLKAEGQPSLVFHICSDGEFEDRLFRTTASEDFLTAWDGIGDDTPVGTDAEAFERRSIAFIPASLRETASILDAAREGPLPQPVKESDIRGIIHAHSVWSDGSHTLQRMAEECRARGLEYLVITDHSRSATYAGGLSIDKVREQHAEIDRLNLSHAPFRIFKGIECDILNDGSLDYPDDILATFEVVIASIHSNLKMSEEKAMHRILSAVGNPHTTILGHMTGRLLLSRPGYPVDHRRVIQACADHGVVIEVNAHPRRLDIDWQWIPLALENDVTLSIDPDAHSVEGFDDIRFGVLASQKGGLTAARNLSSMGLADFERWLQSRRKAG